MLVRARAVVVVIHARGEGRSNPHTDVPCPPAPRAALCCSAAPPAWLASKHLWYLSLAASAAWLALAVTSSSRALSAAYAAEITGLKVTQCLVVGRGRSAPVKAARGDAP